MNQAQQVLLTRRTHSPNRKPIKGPVARRHLPPRQGSADLPPGARSLLGTRQAELRREESEADAERAPRRASPEPGSPWSGRSSCALARETVSALPGRLEGSGKFCAGFRGNRPSSVTCICAERKTKSSARGSPRSPRRAL